MFIEVLTEEQIKILESLAEVVWSGFLYFLITEDNQFIGYRGVQLNGDELFLSKIYMQSSERGKGLGKKAVQFIERLAKQKGPRKIALTVNKNNRDAINAYEKLGFKNLGSLIQEIGGGFIMDDFRMEKTVL